MGCRWGVLGAVAGGTGTLCRPEVAGLPLAEYGLHHDQIALARGEKPASTLLTAAKAGSSVAC